MRPRYPLHNQKSDREFRNWLATEDWIIMQAPAHTASFSITGMTCAHCERAVQGELATLPQLTVVELAAATGALVVSSNAEISVDAVLAAITEAGYAAELTSVR